MKRNGARTWQNHSDAATISKLSLRAAEGYSSFCCLTSKQLSDHIVELKEKTPKEKSEKKKLEMYLEEIVKEVEEKFLYSENFM